MGYAYILQKSQHFFNHWQHFQEISVRNYRLLFFGSDDFSLPHLKSLINTNGNNSISDLRVVATSESTSVFKLATDKNIPVSLWRDVIAGKQPLPPFDFGVVASFGHFIPNWLVAHFTKALINIHPSLLPKWKGPAPIIFSLLRRDKETGVTLIQIDPNSSKFDSGLILDRQQLKHVDDSLCKLTRSELTNNLAQLGAEMLHKVLDNFEYYRNNALPQSRFSNSHGGDGTSMSYRIRREMGRVNWNKMSRADIDALHRSVSDVVPVITQYNNYYVNLIGRVPLELADEAVTQCRPPVPDRSGWIYFSKLCRNILLISCADGKWIGFNSIVLKRPLSAIEFYNGYLAKPNSTKHFTSLDNPLFK